MSGPDSNPHLSAAATPAPGTPDLPFAQKYTRSHAEYYFRKHQGSWGRKLSNWREMRMARRALGLAGNPQSVLDIPCGTGRFWALLAERPDRTIYAADLSEGMLATAKEARPAEVRQRVRCFQASAFAIPQPEGFVEAVFCMRLMHHLGDAAHRKLLLQELARVAASTLIISLWVDGNYKAWRWQVRERRRPHVNRFVVRRAIFEQEIHACGLSIVSRVDFLRYYSMWTTYVLRTRAGPAATTIPERCI